MAVIIVIKLIDNLIWLNNKLKQKIIQIHAIFFFQFIKLLSLFLVLFLLSKIN